MTVLTAAQRDHQFGARCAVPKVTVRNPWGDQVTLHQLVAPVYLEACVAAHDDPFCRWEPHRSDSYACRNVRGSTSPSLHSWALAVDEFATDEGVPPPGGVWKPHDTVPPEFARHFIRRGWRWGRFFTRQDWPHLEWPDEPPGPRPASPVTPEDAMTMLAAGTKAVALAMSPTGNGYAIAADDGAVYCFGDVPYAGGRGGPDVENAPTVDIAIHPSGQGYALLTADGGVFTFGAATFHGSAA